MYRCKHWTDTRRASIQFLHFFRPQVDSLSIYSIYISFFANVCLNCEWICVFLPDSFFSKCIFISNIVFVAAIAASLRFFEISFQKFLETWNDNYMNQRNEWRNVESRWYGNIHSEYSISTLLYTCQFQSQEFHLDLSKLSILLTFYLRLEKQSCYVWKETKTAQGKW